MPFTKKKHSRLQNWNASGDQVFLEPASARLGQDVGEPQLRAIDGHCGGASPATLGHEGHGQRFPADIASSWASMAPRGLPLRHSAP